MGGAVSKFQMAKYISCEVLSTLCQLCQLCLYEQFVNLYDTVLTWCSCSVVRISAEEQCRVFFRVDHFNELTKVYTQFCVVVQLCPLCS